MKKYAFYGSLFPQNKKFVSLAILTVRHNLDLFVIPSLYFTIFYMYQNCEKQSLN